MNQQSALNIEFLEQLKQCSLLDIHSQHYVVILNEAVSFNANSVTIDLAKNADSIFMSVLCLDDVNEGYKVELTYLRFKDLFPIKNKFLFEDGSTIWQTVNGKEYILYKKANV